MNKLFFPFLLNFLCIFCVLDGGSDELPYVGPHMDDNMLEIIQKRFPYCCCLLCRDVKIPGAISPPAAQL